MAGSGVNSTGPCKAMNDNDLKSEKPSSMDDRAARQPGLARLLAAFEELDLLAQELEGGPARRQRERLLAQKRRLRAEILDGLGQRPPRALAALLDRARAPLGPVEQALVLRLLHQRLAAEDSYLSGRDLLWFLTDSSYERLDHLPLLDKGGALMKSGLVLSFTPEGRDAEDLLDRGYGLARAAFRRLTRTRRPRRRAGPRPFIDGVDFLLQMAALVRLAEQRAAAVFLDGYWRELHGEPEEPVEEIERRMDALQAEIRARLTVTRDAERLPLLRLALDFQLGDVELLMVAALATQEALMGLPALEVIDLLRLVSRSSRDLLRRRGLLAADARLRAQDILRLEDGLERNGLTGEVALAPWALDRLVGGPVVAEGRIHPDEKIDFHDFLSRLDGSDDFFEQL